MSKQENNANDNAFGVLLKEIRQFKLFTQSEVEQSAKMSKNYLYMFESGEKIPSLRTARRLANVLESTELIDAYRKIFGYNRTGQLTPAERELIEKVLSFTEPGNITEWAERIARLAQILDIPIVEVCWQGSPRVVATNLIQYMYDHRSEQISELTEITNQAIAKA